MTLYFDNLPDKYEALLTNLMEKSIAYTAAPKNSEISISMVSLAEIRELNLEYRGIDKATDVLSFPLSAPNEWLSNSKPMLGDIIISMDKARESAEALGHSIERELGFLAVHGFLHLAGYDHTDAEEEVRMLAAQREILGDLV